MTLELPPDHIPLVRPTEEEAVEQFEATLSSALTAQLHADSEELWSTIGRFMSGRHVIFLTVHTEPVAPLTSSN